MYVIADVEWVQNAQGKCSPTQLSAARVDSEWNMIDRFSSYIRPKDASFHDWKHMAYTGGGPEEYLFAKGCHSVFEAFRTWVGEDTLCWWHETSHSIYTLIQKVVLRTEAPTAPVILSRYMSEFLKGEGCVKGSPYKLARTRGIEVPTPEHNAENDVLAILALLKGIAFPQEALCNPPVQQEIRKKPSPGQNEGLLYQYDVTNALLHQRDCPLLPIGVERLGFGSLKQAVRRGYKPCACVRNDLRRAKREKVLDEIGRSQYTFMYTEHSSIFHRYDCGLLHNANHVLGAIKYDTILKKGLRPCKVCQPSAEDECNPRLLQRQINAMRTPKLLRHNLSRVEMTAVTRLQQSQKERYSGILHTELSKQQRDDLYTLTQPGFGFFAARGYQSFHVRNCSRLTGRSEIRGFSTFSNACRAGYTPCKYCKPTKKQDVVVSIPINNKIRADETVADLTALCEQYGYGHCYQKGCFALETPVGKWRIHTGARPVTVDHINTARQPGCKQYHRQHRIFLSMLDSLRYIHKHDAGLMEGSAPGAAI